MIGTIPDWIAAIAGTGAFVVLVVLNKEELIRKLKRKPPTSERISKKTKIANIVVVLILLVSIINTIISQWP